MGHTDEANKGGSSDIRAPSRPRIAWARLIGLVHVVQLVLAAVFVARAKGAAGSLAGGAALLCLVTLLLGAPWLLASAKTRGFAVLAAVVPAAAGLAAAHFSMKQALVVYALGVMGSSLGLSFLACLLALRASARPVRLRLGAVGVLACAIAAAGALLLMRKLPMSSILVMAGPVAWGVVVVAVVAAAMGGAYGTRERDAAPQAAFEGVNAILLALGAVGLAAVAVGALRAGVEPAATGTRAQRVWAESIKLLHQSATSGLPILGAGAVVLGASAVRLGHGTRAWGGQTVLIATLVLGITGGCRFELSQTWRAAVRSMARHASQSTHQPRKKLLILRARLAPSRLVDVSARFSA